MRAQPFRRRIGLFDRLDRWLLVFAAVALFLYQPLDAVGHVASKAYEAGNHGLLVRAVAAFDVLDDSLDHGPGRDHVPTVQQQQIIAGLPSTAMAEPVAFVAMAGTWTVIDFFLPPNLLLSELFRPPRV